MSNLKKNKPSIKLASKEVQKECVDFLMCKLGINEPFVRSLTVKFDAVMPLTVNVEYYATDRSPDPSVTPNIEGRLSEVEYHFFNKIHG